MIANYQGKQGASVTATVTATKTRLDKNEVSKGVPRFL